jgi:hypothetical protein
MSNAKAEGELAIRRRAQIAEHTAMRLAGVDSVTDLADLFDIAAKEIDGIGSGNWPPSIHALQQQISRTKAEATKRTLMGSVDDYEKQQLKQRLISLKILASHLADSLEIKLARSHANDTAFESLKAYREWVRPKSDKTPSA